MHASREHDDDRALMIFLVTVIFGMVACAVGLMMAMFRRDEPLLGLAALMITLVAGLAGMLYAGVDSV
ncbi:MAG: hypothetical protein DLM57_18040 [Pseudonocardiales bacterium]|nr:MAG: hypothetical protein DLM57_18040 [Pseudonocardiales bacterium]